MCHIACDHEPECIALEYGSDLACNLCESGASGNIERDVNIHHLFVVVERFTEYINGKTSIIIY